MDDVNHLDVDVLLFPLEVSSCLIEKNKVQMMTLFHLHLWLLSQRKVNRKKIVQNEGFNLFFSLTLGNPIRTNQRKSSRNLRKVLEIPLSLSEYTRGPT